MLGPALTKHSFGKCAKGEKCAFRYECPHSDSGQAICTLCPQGQAVDEVECKAAAQALGFVTGDVQLHMPLSTSKSCAFTRTTDSATEPVHVVSSSMDSVYSAQNSWAQSRKFDASQCFDGNADTMCHSSGSKCGGPAGENHHWLRADLGGVLTAIEITNRKDCCASSRHF